MAKRSGGDGKSLENLVATIERLLVPRGFTVEQNDRVLNDEGVQVAELDIVIRGKVGSGAISWLIECRNRPSDGRAPVAWIEQLVGRRSRLKFNKVTAVSTTGFAAGAAEYAKAEGIDLREVHEVAPDLMAWLGFRDAQSQERRQVLNHACLRISHTEPPELQQAFVAAMTGKGYEERFLQSTDTGFTCSALDAFSSVINENPGFFAGVIPNGSAKRIAFTAQYPNDESHFVVETALGPIRIVEIDFQGELSVIETLVPLSQVAEYRVGENEPVSQTAAFTIQLEGKQVAFELHRLVESGETHMSLRKLSDPGTPPAPEKT